MNRSVSNADSGKAFFVLPLVYVILGITLAEGLRAGADGVSDSAPPATHDQASPQVSIDTSEFTLRSPGRNFDEPGLLKHGGYSTAGAQMTSYRYRNDTSSATVEVVRHPADYAYVHHDFLGTFFYVYQDQKNKKGKDAVEIVIPIEYINWQTEDPVASHTICLLGVLSNGAYRGIAGWYTEADGETTTVMLRYGTPSGLPRNVIGEYLKKYPSTVHGSVPTFESWQADDMAKWINLLSSRGDEDAILSLASTHLRQYDRAAFDLNGVWLKRSDPAARSAGIQAVIGRMNEWTREHQRTRGR